MTTEVLRLGMDTKGFVTGAKSAQTGLQGLITSMSLAQKATLGLGVAVVALGLAYSSAVKGFIEFDAAMTQSLAIMGDVTVAMEQDMVDAARTVAEELNFASAQAAEAFFFLASAGLGAEQSIAALPAVARFARAGMFDLATATDLATDAQSALGLASKDAQVNLTNMTRVTDVLVKANTLANATVEQFSTALTTEAGAALKTFKIDVEEGVAVLAAFADQGVKGQTAGTGLSRILRLMTSAAVNNAAAYEELNVTVFNAEGNIRNLADIIADLERTTSTMSDATRVAAFEQLGFQARVQGIILPLLGTSEAIRDYEAELRKAGGTTQEIADKQMLSLENRIGQIKQAFSNWRDELVEKTVPALGLLIDNADKVADALKAVLLVAGTVGLVAAFVAIGPVIWAAVAAFLALVPAVTSVTAALALLQLAIGPVGWMVIGITAVTALVYKFIRAKRDEKEAIEEANEAAKQALADQLTGLSRLTEAQLKLRQVQLEANIILAEEAMIKDGHIKQDDRRVVQVQEWKTQLGEVTRLLADVNTVTDEGTEAQRKANEALEAQKKLLEDVAAVFREAAVQAKYFNDALDALATSKGAGGLAGVPGIPTLDMTPVVAQLTSLQAVLDKLGFSVISTADTMTDLSDSTVALGDAFGIIDSNARGAISGLFELADGIKLLQEAANLEGLTREQRGAMEGTGTQAAVAGMVAIASGVIGTIGGFLRTAEESRQRHERMEMARLDQEREAVESFKDSVTAFGEFVGSTPTQVTAAFEALMTELAGLGVRTAKARAPEPIDREAFAADIIKKYEEHIRNLNAAFQEDLSVRALLAQGMDDDAARMRLEIDQRRELADAMSAGWDDETIARLREVQGMEWDAFIASLEDIEEAGLSAAEALAQLTAKFNDFRVRALSTLGFGEEASILRSEMGYTAELGKEGLSAGDRDIILALRDAERAYRERQRILAAAIDNIELNLAAKLDELKAAEEAARTSLDAKLDEIVAAENAVRTELSAKLDALNTTEDAVRANLAAQLEGIDDQIAIAQASKDQYKDAISAAKLQVDGINDQISLARKSLQVAESQLREQEQLVSATRQVVDSLGAFGGDLALSGQSTLSPTRKLVEARSQYEAMLAAAQGGDIGAASGLPGAAKAFLEASRAVHASSTLYAADYEYVQASIDSIRGQFQAQLTVEEQMLAQLQAQTAGIESQLATLEASKAAAEAQLAETQAAAAAANAAADATIRALRERAEQAKADAQAIIDKLRAEAADARTLAQATIDQLRIDAADARTSAQATIDQLRADAVAAKAAAQAQIDALNIAADQANLDALNALLELIQIVYNTEVTAKKPTFPPPPPPRPPTWPIELVAATQESVVELRANVRVNQSAAYENARRLDRIEAAVMSVNSSVRRLEEVEVV